MDTFSVYGKGEMHRVLSPRTKLTGKVNSQNELQVSCTQCALGGYAEAWASPNLLAVSDVRGYFKKTLWIFILQFVAFSILILPLVCFWTNALDFVMLCLIFNIETMPS